MMTDALRGASDEDNRDAFGPEEYGGQAEIPDQSGHFSPAPSSSAGRVSAYPGEPSSWNFTKPSHWLVAATQTEPVNRSSHSWPGRSSDGAQS